MKFIEIKEYSPCTYIPKSKDSAKDRDNYRKRLYYGYGIIDLDSIVSIEPTCSYDAETLETEIAIYTIYFRGNETRVYTDIDGYNLIKKYLFKETTENTL